MEGAGGRDRGEEDTFTNITSTQTHSSTIPSPPHTHTLTPTHLCVVAISSSSTNGLSPEEFRVAVKVIATAGERS